MSYPKQKRLIGLRHENSLNQKDMALLLGINETSYMNKELGNTDFKLSEALKIANHFSKTVEDIFLNKSLN